MSEFFWMIVIIIDALMFYFLGRAHQDHMNRIDDIEKEIGYMKWKENNKRRTNRIARLGGTK